MGFLNHQQEITASTFRSQICKLRFLFVKFRNSPSKIDSTGTEGPGGWFKLDPTPRMARHHQDGWLDS